VWRVRQLANVKRKYLKDIFGIDLPVSPGKKRRSQHPVGGGLDLQEQAGSLEAALGERKIVSAQTETVTDMASITADHVELAVAQPCASRKRRLQGATLGF
jgi:hypothetical protein